MVLPIAMVCAFLIVLYGEFRLLEFAVDRLNRIPNLPQSRHLTTLFYAAIGLAVLLAAIVALSTCASNRTIRQRAYFGGSALAGSVVLGWTPFPLCLLGVLLCCAAAAVYVAGLLRIPFDAQDLPRPLRALLPRALLDAVAAFSFALLALLLAKRVVMEFRID